MGVLGVGRIHEEESAVVCPVIDVIDWNTFEYLGNSGEPQIGGFDWRLVFTWHVVPERERMRMRSPVDVIRSGVNLSEPHCIWLPCQRRPLGGIVSFWVPPSTLVYTLIMHRVTYLRAEMSVCFPGQALWGVAVLPGLP